MPGSFVVTAATNSVQLNNNRTGQASFTVFNSSGRPARGRSSIVPLQDETEAWYSLNGDMERDFSIASTSQYTVQISVPSDVEAGSYSFRLNMVGVENPDEDFTEGPAVTFEVPEPEEKKPFPWKIPAIIAAVVLVVVIAALGFVFTRGGGPNQVPEVAASSVSDATNTLTDAGFVVSSETTEEFSSEFAQGIVIGTDPAVDSEVEEGSIVSLIVSGGPDPSPTTVPTITVTPAPTSTSIPTAPTPITGAVQTAIVQTVVAQTATAEAVMTQTAVAIATSTAEVVATQTAIAEQTAAAQVNVPDVSGMTVSSATNQLRDATLVVSQETRQPSETVSENRVVGTQPAIGTIAARGSEVTIIVSTGPAAVKNRNDSGAGSLRQAIANANAGDVIDFSVSGTITLTSGELVINKDLTISGPGEKALTILGRGEESVASLRNASGASSGRIFNITGGSVEISNLTLSNGLVRGGNGGNGASPGGGGGGGGGVGMGGAVFNGENATLTLSNVSILESQAVGGNGGNGPVNGGAFWGVGGSGGAGGSSSTVPGGVFVVINAPLAQGLPGSANGFGGGGSGGGAGSLASGPGGAGGFGGGGGGGGARTTGGDAALPGSGGFGGGSGGQGTSSGGSGGGGGAGMGGAIFNNGGTLTINDSTISRNTATGGEGGTSAFDSKPGGNGTGLGGGIFTNGGTITLNNVSFSRNSADDEPNLYNRQGSVTLNGTTP